MPPPPSSDLERRSASGGRADGNVTGVCHGQQSATQTAAADTLRALVQTQFPRYALTDRRTDLLKQYRVLHALISDARQNRPASMFVVNHRYYGLRQISGVTYLRITADLQRCMFLNRLKNFVFTEIFLFNDYLHLQTTYFYH